MRIDLTSVMVDDQSRALAFYTDALGFVKKLDIPMGPHRWLTVVSADAPEEPQLLLEPAAFPPAQAYQRALFEAGIPAASFRVDDLAREHERLAARGVVFRSGPVEMGPVLIAVLEDTVGNLIQLRQHRA